MLQQKTVIEMEILSDELTLKNSEDYDVAENAEVHKRPATGTESAFFETLGTTRMLNTRLLDAIENQDNAEVERLLEAGASPNATCRKTLLSAVHVAAMINAGALQVLLDCGALQHRVELLGCTPLVVAALNGATQQLAKLLGLSDDLQKKVTNGMTPQTEGEMKRQSLHAKFRLDEMPAEVEMRDVPDAWMDSIEHKHLDIYTKTYLPAFDRSWSPLDAATCAARQHCVRLLLAAGADPNLRNSYGANSLDMAGFSCFHNVHIGEDDFYETISALLEYGGKPSMQLSLHFDSLVHTAVRVGGAAALARLLAAGAPCHHHNSEGYAPIHECVLTKKKTLLQILANFSSPQLSCRTVDLRDKFGFTVLMLAVDSAWVPGISVALQAGADVSLTDDDGNNAVHLAAEKGDPEILREILNSTNLKNGLNTRNKNGETPLTKAIYAGNLRCVSFLLEHGAFNHRKDILHVATSAGNTELLEFLLNYRKNRPEDYFKALLHHEAPGLGNKTPLEYAVEKDQIGPFKFLLQQTINSDYDYDDIRRLIDIVATLNRTQFFDYILESGYSNIVSETITNGSSLHKAIVNRSRDMAIALVRSGADLSRRNESDQTAVELITSHIFKPTEFLANLFDMFIYSNDKNIVDADCEIVIDYTVLMPRDNDNEPKLEEMNVLEALLETGNSKGQRSLLAHPLVESFLYLKWKTLSHFIYFSIVLYSMFLISLNIYIISCFYYKKNNKNGIGNPNSIITELPRFFEPDIWRNYIYVTAAFIAIQELFVINLKRFQCLVLDFKFWVINGTLSLAITTPSLISKDSLDNDWRRNTANLTVILSWMNMYFLLSWLPTCGYYMHMFRKVSSEVIKIISCFSFLFICFSINFMIQFKFTGQFEDPASALFKTVVMMNSEFDYSALFKDADITSSVILVQHILCLSFIALIAIVLMNLMIGVAVSDLQVLTHEGHLRRLEKQVACLSMIEALINIRHLDRFLKCYRQKVDKKVTIKPSKNYWYLYAGHIREVIINKAQSQYQMKEMINEDKKTKRTMEKVLEIAKTKGKDTKGNDDERDRHLNKMVEKTVKKVVEELKSEIESKVNQTNVQLSATNQMLNAILNKIRKNKGNKFAKKAFTIAANEPPAAVVDRSFTVGPSS